MKNLPFIKNYDWKRIFIFIGISLILAIPWPIYRIVGKFYPHEENIKKDLDLQTYTDPLSSSLLSRAIGIKLFTMNKRLCLNNRNRILFDGAEKQQSEILESKDGASMSLKVYYQDGTMADLYTHKDEYGCLLLNSKYSLATTTNTVDIKKVLPIETPFVEYTTDGQVLIKAKIASLSDIDFSKSEVVEMIDFNLWIYLKNVILILIGMIIFFSAIIQIRPHFKRK